jgi:hypothetical protein
MYHNDRELAVVTVRPDPDQATGQTKTPVESSSDVLQEPDSTISQAELRAYVDQANLCREHHRLRESIPERLERGVPVEPGELKVAIEPDYVRRWSSRAAHGTAGPREDQRALEPTSTNSVSPVAYSRRNRTRRGVEGVLSSSEWERGHWRMKPRSERSVTRA